MAALAFDVLVIRARQTGRPEGTPQAIAAAGHRRAKRHRRPQGQPTPTFAPVSLTRALRHYIRPYYPTVGLNLAANLLMVLFSVVSIPALIPFLQLLLKQTDLTDAAPPLSFSVSSITANFNLWVSDIVRANGYERAMVYMCIFLVSVFVLKNLFGYLSVTTLALIRSGLIRDLRRDLYHHIINMPVGYFTEARRGDLISRFTADVQEVENSVLNSIQSLVQNPLLISGALVVMLSISPYLTVFTVILIGVTGVIIGGIGRRLKAQSGEVQETLGDMTNQLDETIGGLRVVKAFGAEGYVEARFGESNNRYRDVLVRLLRRRDLSMPLSEVLGVAVVCLLIYVGFQEINAGRLEVAVFIGFIYAFFSTIQPSKSFSNSFYSLQRGRAAFERVQALLDTPNTIVDAPGAVSLARIKEGIRVEDVHFSYPNTERPALAGVTLDLPVGKVVALVGPSGAGKSTLADLLPRFYDVDGGRITIDGHDVRGVRLADLRQNIGIVSQDVVLFHDTILENIRFGSVGKSDGEVIAAAKLANAHTFIEEQPQGYQTVIGERGTRLSGGQRQRLTIARAILRDTPIMILDEATSALDAESEALIQDALFRLMEGRTCLVIAHRLATIQRADEIVVLDHGRVIERGDHATLVERGGAYARLLELQRVGV